SLPKRMIMFEAFKDANYHPEVEAITYLPEVDLDNPV
uniref:Ribulose-bisphosphate carboxylase n=1 Tax=Steinernema glaseri TaxID=37863 RepID=A0A1I8ACL7_9BILA